MDRKLHLTNSTIFFIYDFGGKSKGAEDSNKGCARIIIHEKSPSRCTVAFKSHAQPP
jgi:hypothetical protein